MKNYLIKYKIHIAILAIIAVSLFLRTYHLADWLHFQLDQSRDSFLIKEVIEKGIAELPLLGPRAGGSFLRLGPAYYYMMYLLVLAAQSFHPVVYALPGIIGSIAFVPIFYILVRRIFDQKLSIILTILAATSTFLVTYDRFSWNPNLMPLFSALTMYAWLRYLEAKRKKDEKKSIFWVAITALSVGIIIQLHFEAFITIPIILSLSIAVFILWFLKHKHVTNSWRIALSFARDLGVFALVILLLHLPVVLNEYVANGANTKEFFATILEKQENDKLHNLSEQLIQNISVYPKGFYNVITGTGGVYFPTVLTRPSLNVMCDYNCRSNMLPTIAAAAIFLLVAGVFIGLMIQNVRNVFNKKHPTSHQDLKKFEYFVLLTAWIIVPWWAFYSISFNLRPRFFLFVAVPFWIIAGIFLEKILRGRFGKALVGSMVIALVISNFSATYSRFNELANAEVQEKDSYPEDQIFYRNEKYPTTLSQQNKISQWISEKYKQNDKNGDYLFIWAPPYFYRPILYLLENNEKVKEPRYFSTSPSMQNAAYFAVTRTTDPNDFFRKDIPDLFITSDKKSFGTLTVYQLELTAKGIEETKKREKTFLRNEVITDPARTKRVCLEKPTTACRFTWGDVFK